MSSVPSVKGTIFAAMAGGMRQMEKDGVVTRAELEKRLSPEALRYLDETIVPVLWYPVSAYSELSELNWEIAGNNRPEFQLEAGRRAAERLAASGPYKSMNAKISDWGQRITDEQASLFSALYNFLNVNVRDDPPTRSIELTGAAPLPESWRFATQGFIDYLARRNRNERIKVTSERPTPDKIVFQLWIG